MNHKEFQAKVIELAHSLGWAHLHVRRAQRGDGVWTTATNLSGWPDLLFWAPARGFVAIELKVGRDKPRPAQLAVLSSLEAAGARTMVAYPNQMDEIANLLRHRRLTIEAEVPEQVTLPITPPTQGD